MRFNKHSSRSFLAISAAFLSSLIGFSSVDAAINYTTDGVFTVDFTDETGFVGSSSSLWNNAEYVPGSHIQLDSQADPVPTSGTFSTVEIKPYTLGSWGQVLINNGVLPTGTTLNLYDCTSGTPVEVTGYTNISTQPIDISSLATTISCLQVGVNLTDASAQINHIQVDWVPMPVLAMTISGPTSTPIGQSITYELQYSVSYENTNNTVLWVEIPELPMNQTGSNAGITGYTGAPGVHFYGQDAALSPIFENATDDGVFTETGAVVAGISIPPNSVYWNLGSVPSGTTETLQFTIGTLNGIEAGIEYEFLGAINADLANAVMGTASTFMVGAPEPFIDKSVTNGVNNAGIQEFYVVPGSTEAKAKYKIRIENTMNPFGRETIFNPTLTDNLSDIRTKLESANCVGSPIDLTQYVSNIVPSPSPSSSFFSGGNTLEWTALELGGNILPAGFVEVFFEVELKDCATDNYPVINKAELTGDNILTDDNMPMILSDTETITIRTFPVPTTGDFGIGNSAPVFLPDNNLLIQNTSQYGSAVVDDLVPGSYDMFTASDSGKFWVMHSDILIEKHGQIFLDFAANAANRFGSVGSGIPYKVLPSHYGDTIDLTLSMGGREASVDIYDGIMFNKIPSGVSFSRAEIRDKIEIYDQVAGAVELGTPIQWNTSESRSESGSSVKLPPGEVFVYDSSVGVNSSNNSNNPPDYYSTIWQDFRDYDKSSSAATLNSLGWFKYDETNLYSGFDPANVSWVAFYYPCTPGEYAPDSDPVGNLCYDQDTLERYYMSGHAAIEVTIDTPTQICNGNEITNAAVSQHTNYRDDNKNQFIPLESMPAGGFMDDDVDLDKIFIDASTVGLSANSTLVGDTTVLPGEDIHYDIILNNFSSITATGVTVTLDIPQVTANGVSTPLIFLNATGADMASIDTSGLPNTVVLNMGTIEPFSQSYIDLQVQVPNGTVANQTIEMSMSVNSAGGICPEPTGSNITASTLVLGETTRLEVNKSVDEPIIDSGGAIHYNISLQNTGETASTETFIFDKIPEDVVFSRAYTSGTDITGTSFTCHSDCEVYFGTDTAFGGDITPTNPLDFETATSAPFELGTESIPGVWIPSSIPLEDVRYVIWTVDQDFGTGEDLFPTGATLMVGLEVINDLDNTNGVSNPQLDGSSAGKVLYNATGVGQGTLLQAIGNRVETTIIEGRIGNIVFNDNNGNGIYEPANGELGINNILVELYIDTDGDKIPDTLYDSVITGDNPNTTAVESGWYMFYRLPLNDGINDSQAYSIVIPSGQTALDGLNNTIGATPEDNTNGPNNNSQNSTGYLVTLLPDDSGTTGNESTHLYADFGFSTNTTIAVDDDYTASPLTETSQNFTPLNNDTDSENDTQTITGVTPPSFLTVDIATDGLSVDVSIDPLTFNPSDPSVTDNGNGTYTISVPYDITDDNSDTATDSAVMLFSYALTNTTIAVDDTSVTQVNTPIIIEVSQNDLDPEGDIDLSTMATGGTCTPPCQNPTNGQIILISGTGNIIYTPNTNFSGVDTFEYEICDIDGNCDIALVTVTIQKPTTSPVELCRTNPLLPQCASGSVESIPPTRSVCQTRTDADWLQQCVEVYPVGDAAYESCVNTTKDKEFCVDQWVERMDYTLCWHDDECNNTVELKCFESDINVEMTYGGVQVDGWSYFFKDPVKGSEPDTLINAIQELFDRKGFEYGSIYEGSVIIEDTPHVINALLGINGQKNPFSICGEESEQEPEEELLDSAPKEEQVLAKPAKPQLPPVLPTKQERVKDDFVYTTVIPETGFMSADLIRSYKAESIFTDTDVNDPHYKALVVMYLQGVMDAPDMSIMPDQIVTVSEAAEMVLKASEIAVKAIQDDVLNPYLTHAVLTGLMSDEDPNTTVTPEIFKAMTQKALGVENITEIKHNTDNEVTRAEAAEILYQSVQTSDTGDKVYVENIKIDIPKHDIEDLTATRGLLSHSSVWLRALSQTGASFYDDIQEDGSIITILFAHSSVWEYDNNPTGAIFEPLINGLKPGDTFEVNRDNKTYIYQVTEGMLVKPEDVDALENPTEGTDFILFTCDEDYENGRWIYYAEDITPTEENLEPTVIRVAPVPVLNTLMPSTTKPTETKETKPREYRSMPSFERMKQKVEENKTSASTQQNRFRRGNVLGSDLQASSFNSEELNNNEQEWLPWLLLLVTLGGVYSIIYQLKKHKE